MTLERLFDLELQYRPGIEPVAPAEKIDGTPLGSGDGTISGPRLRGSVRWSSFMKPATDGCQLGFTGFLETDDGARIPFDAIGFALGRDQARPAIWSVDVAVQFEPEDERYAWLRPVPVVLDGEFDYDNAHGRYTGYARLHGQTYIPTALSAVLERER